MNRYLEFFELDAGVAIEKSLERAFELGARKAIVIGTQSVGWNCQYPAENRNIMD